MFHALLSLLLTVSQAPSQELTHFCFQDEVPQKTKDHLPIGTCWYCENCGEEQICVENCIYECLNPCCLRGVWLPEAPPLFLPFKADPRQLAASAGWRFSDQALDDHVIDVSYFDTIPVYRWFNIFAPCGQLELDVDGALWAVFQPCAPESPLTNGDYYIGFSLNYALGPLSFRLRGYHISSHIGDEFLIAHPDFDRKNPSSEYIDFFGSYWLNDDLRFYLGAGVIVHRDPTFPFKRFFGEGGAEAYLPWFRFFSTCQMVEGKPYFAMHFRVREDNKWDFDQTYALGYEFGKLYGLERKLRFYLEFHDGYSVEGQFCRHRTDYISIRASYGF